METTPQQRNFVRTLLPWIIAAVMLVAYLITMNKVVTLQSAFPLAKASGLDWRPTHTQPLHWLVTLPVKALPASAQLAGLNLISVICAALSLGLLARCVSLLPHDRTQLQRDKLKGEDSFLSVPLAWVPVVFAVLICGLQRSFWEHAVVNTGEMLDLLLFAYCVRCLLEYRIDERTSWLYRLAVVYGAGIANNFALIGFLPLLVASLIWIKGLRFFRFDFLVRMFLLGLAGLSLYLLLPVVQLGSDVEPVSFWKALKANIGFQKHALLTNRRMVLLPAVYALLPLLLVSIRWPSGFGDSSPVGSFAANLAAVLLHVGLMVYCIYVAFDPPVSPREVGAPYREAGLQYIFLPCYFLGALSIGYFAGFLLQVFSSSDSRSRRRGMPVPPVVSMAVAVVVCGGAAFVSGRLLMQNLPKIREGLSASLEDYAASLAKSLPEKSSIVLSDDLLRLYAVAHALGRDALSKHVLIETASLGNPTYHKFLHHRYGNLWPKSNIPAATGVIAPAEILKTLTAVARERELVYLHPSFGYYFESFYLEPRGTAYLLKPYAEASVEAPVPSAAQIAQQNTVWNGLATGPWKELKASIAKLPQDPSERYQFNSAYVGFYYSRALNWWGVELQRAKQFEQADNYFQQAIALNPDNVAAIINHDANVAWRKDGKTLQRLSETAEKKLRMYGGINELLGACGPVDVPEMNIEVAQAFIRFGHFRQAAQMVTRALAFSPGNLSYETALANIALASGNPDRALNLINPVRQRISSAIPGLQIEAARIAAYAENEKDNFTAAERLLQETLRKFPNEDASHNQLAQLYISRAMKMRTENKTAEADKFLASALRVVQAQVAAQPGNASAYFNQGALEMFANDFTRAAASFSKVMELQKDNSAALLNRAICYLQAKKYDLAKRDYQTLLSKYTTTDFRVFYGLGEIAYQEKNWKAAREHYEQYLRYAPAGSAEAAAIRQKLQEVKGKS